MIAFAEAIITPSNLWKQWHQELSEKFFLPCKALRLTRQKQLENFDEEVHARLKLRDDASRAPF